MKCENCGSQMERRYGFMWLCKKNCMRSGTETVYISTEANLPIFEANSED